MCVAKGGSIGFASNGSGNPKLGTRNQLEKWFELAWHLLQNVYTFKLNTIPESNSKYYVCGKRREYRVC